MKITQRYEISIDLNKYLMRKKIKPLWPFLLNSLLMFNQNAIFLY